MAVDVRCEIEIERPRAEVAAFAGDLDNTTVWYENIDTVVWRSPKPAAIGSRIEFGASFLGRRLNYTYEITELEPGRRLVMATAEGPFPMETTYAWDDTPRGGTGWRCAAAASRRASSVWSRRWLRARCGEPIARTWRG